MSSERLQNYPFIMYDKSPEASLQAGDVIALTVDDIKMIARYDTIVPLFEQYAKDDSYGRPLWCVLNKTCDMVFESEKRSFKSNLLIVPLIGLRHFIKKAYLGEIWFKTSETQAPKKFVLDKYKSFMGAKVRAECPVPEGTAPAIWHKKLNIELIEPAVKNLSTLLEGLGDDDPEELVLTLIESLKSSSGDEGALATFEEFRSSKDFTKGLKKFREAAEKSQIDPKILVLKKTSGDALGELTINQREAAGFFFYEPHPLLSSVDDDLAFVIKLDDIISIKLKHDLVTNGAIQKVLLERRVVSLTANFSDRLQNIMGNYFSKVATPDVLANTVLELYAAELPKSFFMTYDAYEAMRPQAAMPITPEITSAVSLDVQNPVERPSD